jgi:Spy/CpxP family protein refolding chaperone
MFRSLLILALPAALLTAQGGPPPAAGLGGPGMGPRRELIVARLRQFRMERLQQLLGISEEKARTIADRWTQFDQDSQDNRQRMRQLREQVNGILLSPVPEDEKNAKIRPMVEQFSTLRQQQQDQKRKFEDDIRASLTPAQQARFILVVEDIQHAMMEAIKERRGGISGQ